MQYNGRKMFSNKLRTYVSSLIYSLLRYVAATGHIPLKEGLRLHEKLRQRYQRKFATGHIPLKEGLRLNY